MGQNGLESVAEFTKCNDNINCGGTLATKNYYMWIRKELDIE